MTQIEIHKIKSLIRVVRAGLTRDAGPKPHIVWHGFLGFAEKNPRGSYIVGQAQADDILKYSTALGSWVTAPAR